MRTRPERMRRAARSFREMAIEMGGVMIKVGQFLSARVDVLPDEITTELAGLQDEVEPEDFEDIRRVLEGELRAPILEKFAAFESEPLAAASLGQVHRAQLHADEASGEPPFWSVVVKVQRPNIEIIIATDLAALRWVGRWLKRYPPIQRRVSVEALLSEFTRILYEEIDYLAEGRNAETFAAHFQDRPGVRVPGVVWPLTTKRILTLEDVYAIKITDYQAITDAGVDRPEVARRLFQTYLQQIFEDDFFHADPHPGNLFVTPLPAVSGEKSPRWLLTFVDFGMVGRIPPNLREGLREMVISIGMRDSARMIKAFQILGVLLPGADLELIEKAAIASFDLVWGKNMAEMQDIQVDELRAMTYEFRELLYSLPFQLPEDLILLGRTVGILSGMCTGLDPQFNVWLGLVPFTEKLVAEEARMGWDFWVSEGLAVGRSMLGLPKHLESVLIALERGEISVRIPEIMQEIRRLERTAQRAVGAVIFAAFLIAGMRLLQGGWTVLGSVLLVGAVFALIWVFFTQYRRK